jgi:hypothetical protein
MIYHLLFKALFKISRDRQEFLANLFCKPIPLSGHSKQAGIADLLPTVDLIPASQTLFQKNLIRVKQVIQKELHFPLSPQDVKTVNEIYREFFDQQLEIRFRSFGRPSFRFYPSFKEITLEKDLEGKYGNYLNSEEDFQFIKRLHARNLIVPVIGDFSGQKALRAVGAYLREIGETVALFYVSNVEFYLFQNGVFERYGENIKQLPLSDSSLFIRAYFRFPHPERRPGYISATVLQRMRTFIQNLDAGHYRSYQDLGVLDFLLNE